MVDNSKPPTYDSPRSRQGPGGGERAEAVEARDQPGTKPSARDRQQPAAAPQAPPPAAAAGDEAQARSLRRTLVRCRLPRSGIDFLAALTGILLGIVAFAHFAPLADPRALIGPPGTVVLASDGTILWRDTEEGVRIPVSLDSASPAVIAATIAAEDKRFRSHPGIDPLAIARAFIRFPSQRSGASTITQQLARRLYLQGQPLLLRKGREAEIAFQLEARYSKDEILELYLNSVYYGRGAYGIEAAARVYFGVSAANLDLARAAFLAGLTQAPAIGEEAGKAARDRQRYVLDRMKATGAIDEVRRRAALAAPLGVRPALDPAVAVHFVSFAREEAERLLPGAGEGGGLIIETTLNPTLELATEQQARLQLARLAPNDAGNATAVVLDPRDGRILAMAGNISRTGEGSAFNMSVERRQPGSALKPFLYGLALQSGFTAASPLLDVPSTFQTAAGTPYSPQDHDRRFRGVVTLRTALASSLNVPAVAMLEQLGPEMFAGRLRDLGIGATAEPDQDGLALALGSAEVSLLELVAAYGALADGGVRFEPFAVTRIRNSAGELLYERPGSGGRRVVPEAVAFIISDILADPAARIPTFGAGSLLDLPFPAAVKTGTTTGFRDNWTVGYTPRQVVGVWVGNADNRPMRDISGVDGAAPIWAEVMKAARGVQGDASFLAPASVSQKSVCMPTGLLPGPDCPLVESEWFVRGTEPIAEENYYVLSPMTGQITINAPAEARPWLAEAGYRLSTGGAPDTGGLAISRPAPGEILYLAPELGRQEFIIRVGCPAGPAALTVFLDDREIAATQRCADTIVAPLEPGPHTVMARAMGTDGKNLEASTSFEVRSQ